MWAPDARAFKRATYMSSTDDVELLGKVKGEGEDDEENQESKGHSTTPFGPHAEAPEELAPEQEAALDSMPVQDAEPETVEAGATDIEPDPPEEAEPPSVDSEVEGAIAALEAEVSTPELDPEASAQMEKDAFSRGKATAMAEMSSKIEQTNAENERLQSISERIEPLVNELESLRTNIIRKASEDLAEMALHMARRVVGETLAVHPQALRKLVSDALERLPGEDEVTIRVRPEDLSVIEQHLPTRRKIRLLADESLEGGCVVEAQCGEVSASVEAAFTGLRAAVEEWLEEQK